MTAQETIISTQKATMLGQSGTRFLIGDEEYIDLPYAGFLIADCGLNDMSDQGKGYGKELYSKALSDYGVLYSVWPVSDDAFRVHDSLIKSGIARREPLENDYGIIALVKN